MIDVTISGIDGAYACVIDACEGASAQTGTGSTPDTAVDDAVAKSIVEVFTFARASGASVGPAELATIEIKIRNAASVALYAFVTPATTYPDATGFGTDVSTFPDLDPTLAIISGNRVIAEATARRLLTPRGSLAYDPDYGYDVRALLNEGLDVRRIEQLRSEIADECEKDERVLAADVELTFIPQSSTLTVRVKITTQTGTFVLVLTVSTLAADLTVLNNP